MDCHIQPQGVRPAISSPSLLAIIAVAHDVDHEGIQKTLHRVRGDFYMPGMRRAVEDFVRDYTICQRNKTTSLHPVGLLQPLPVPTQVWEDIAMDFIEGLPRVNGKIVVLTVVDRFSKYVQFTPLAHPYTATSVARTFFTDIVCLHGLPATIISNRDPIFTSHFWKELFHLSGVSLHMSTAFHLQSDRQSEVVIEMYL